MLLDFHFHQGGEWPHGYCVFGRINKVDATEVDAHPPAPDHDDPGRALRGNGMGSPWNEDRPDLGVYAFWIAGNVGGVAALQRVQWFDAGVCAKTDAGSALFDALADQCYELLDLARALNSTATILADLGVEVRGNNPFPE